MSFLVEDDDTHRTLQVAFAFIDAYDGDSSATTTSSTRGSDSPHSDGSSLSPLSAHMSMASAGVAKPLSVTEPKRPKPSRDGQRHRVKALREQEQPKIAAARSARATKSHLEAVRRNRAKKNAEAALLREQVAQLEAKLKQLQLARRIENSSLEVYFQRAGGDKLKVRTSGGRDGGQDVRSQKDEMLIATVPPNAPVSLWQELAVAEAHKKLKSQALNTELKTAVKQQLKLVKSLEALLLNKKTAQVVRFALLFLCTLAYLLSLSTRDLVFTIDHNTRDDMYAQGLDLLREEQEQFQYNSAVLTQETGILADLQRRVHQMYLEMESFFAQSLWTEIADSVVFSSQLKITPGVGPVVELRMNAPLRCNFRDAGDAVWRQAMEISAFIETPTYSLKKHQLTSSSFQKTYKIILEGPDGSTMELRGTSYIQRFVGADHDAFMWASALQSSKGGKVFREKGWVVASSVSSGDRSGEHKSAPPTLCRGYSQVSCDGSRDEGPHLQIDERTNNSEARYQHAFILKFLANRTRAYYEFTQNLLLSEFAGGSQARQPLFLLSGPESR